MFSKFSFPFLLVFGLLSSQACQSPGTSTNDLTESPAPLATAGIEEKLDKYISVPLTADLSKLSENHQKMIPILIEAGKIMDKLFWYEAYGKKDSLLEVTESPELEQYIRINYGPWDRLEGNEPFVLGAGPKPAGANFYPADMTKEEFVHSSCRCSFAWG